MVDGNDGGDFYDLPHVREARAPNKALLGGPNRRITGQWSEEEDHIR